MSLCDIIKLENRKYKLIQKTSERFSWEEMGSSRKMGGSEAPGYGKTEMSATKSIHSGRRAGRVVLMVFNGLVGLEWVKLCEEDGF